MPKEVRPNGVRCNINCSYCYQMPIRNAGNWSKPYDIEAMKKAILENDERNPGHFVMFGGEPLLMPIEDLEEMFRFGYKHYQQNGIQTNGSLITEEHIELFKRYNVGPGLSIDGPDELNDARWAGSEKRTREMTRRSIQALMRLIEEGLNPGLIVTLHRLNASAERLPKLLEWFKMLDEKGLQSVNLHTMQTESPALRAKLGMTNEEYAEAYKKIYEQTTKYKNMRIRNFKDILTMLRGDDRNAVCIWKACDPYDTQAVAGIEAHGESSNCGRSNFEGIDWVKAERRSWERQIVLYQTPQEYGGCKGCRFWYACKGECPGESIRGDWRNRSTLCSMWKELYSYFEERLVSVGEIPLSLAPEREKVEQILFDGWTQGVNVSVYDAYHMAKRGQSCHTGTQPPTGHRDHRDHRDSSRRNTGHRDHTNHEDVEHRDHTDTGALKR